MAKNYPVSFFLTRRTLAYEPWPMTDTVVKESRLTLSEGFLLVIIKFSEIIKEPIKS